MNSGKLPAETLRTVPAFVRAERLLSRRQAAELLSVTTRFLDYQRSAGRIRSFKVGNVVRFRLSDLKAYVEASSRHV